MVDTIKKGVPGMGATRGCSYSPLFVPDFPMPFSWGSRFLQPSCGTSQKNREHSWRFGTDNGAAKLLA